MKNELKEHLSKYVSTDWLNAMPQAFEYFTEIVPKLREEYIEGGLRPHPDLIFRAFQLTPLATVSVVLMSRSPYKDGSANGLAFDCVRGVKVPPSLASILQVIQEEQSTENTYSGVSYLDHLPRQGVLLLNRSMTTSASNTKFDHKALWEPFHHTMVDLLNSVDNIVWALMGESVHDVRVSNPTHIKLELPNPSPLAGKQFLSSKFSTIINTHLRQVGRPEIRW